MCLNNGLFMWPFMALGWTFMAIGWILGLILFVFWLLMIIDCITRKMDKFDKIIWVIVLVFLQFIGALIYYLLVKRRKHKK